MRKTQEEIDAMSPAELKAYIAGQRDIVFGSDAPRDGRGRPVGHGIGSPLQPTRNHVEALRNSIREGHTKDPDGSILAREEKALADYERRQRRRPGDDADGSYRVLDIYPATEEGRRRSQERIAAEARGEKPYGNDPPLVRKPRGNPAGLVKARAAAKAKREARAAGQVGV